MLEPVWTRNRGRCLELRAHVFLADVRGSSSGRVRLIKGLVGAPKVGAVQYSTSFLCTSYCSLALFAVGNTDFARLPASIPKILSSSVDLLLSLTHIALVKKDNTE